MSDVNINIEYEINPVNIEIDNTGIVSIQLENSESEDLIFLELNETINSFELIEPSLINVVDISTGAQGPMGLTGPQGPQGAQGPAGVSLSGDLNYIHNQIGASTIWTVNHNLNKYPSVVVVDSGGTVVYGEVEYLDLNNLIILFSAPFGGKSYLN